MTDEALMAIFKNNPHLGRLVLQGCINFTDKILEALQQHPIEQLWLIDAPRITDEGIAHIAQLPLRSLRLEECPQLTENCMPHLQKLKLESLYLKDCGISEAKFQILKKANFSSVVEF